MRKQQPKVGGPDSSEEIAAASEAAIDADRNAAVASSGMSSTDVDADSQSALFGDAVPEASTISATKDDSLVNDESTFATESTPSSSSDATVFGGDGVTSNETTFGDDFSNSDFSSQSSSSAGDGELFSDTPSSTSTGDDDQGGGILQTLWDMFTSDE